VPGGEEKGARERNVPKVDLVGKKKGGNGGLAYYLRRKRDFQEAESNGFFLS